MQLRILRRELRLILFFAGGILLTFQFASAATRTSVQNGYWSVATTWNPAGIPAAGDNIVVANGNTVTLDADQTIQNVTVNAGSTLRWNSGKKLTINGNTTVNGIAQMNGGDIQLGSPGLGFTLGPTSVFTWEPATNTAAGASLFVRGSENFAPTSTLIIKKWYNYTIPLAMNVSGNFGNLTMNSPGVSNTLVEWNQQNLFASHQIYGTLTIDQGWITLDKSGSITSTTIGNIVLTSVNSSFYGHNGTHPSSFTLNTGSVTNNGGNFFGLNNGNGNVTVNISGNFSNIGNVKIINNQGISNVGNGNATFNVGGTFSQSTGDTRILYNVTTLNSGTFTSTINNLNLTGGIFMGQTGCHTASGTCSLTITQDLNINFTNGNDKFRCTSLSSIGSSVNNINVNFTVGRNFNFSGPSAAEFTSAASSGTETCSFAGDMSVSGGTACFNYGTAAAAHDLSLQISGRLTISGGTCFLSRNNGTATITVGGTLSLSSGYLALKGGSGSTNLTVNGDFQQDGGYYFLHSNATSATSNPVRMNVSGNYAHSAGIFSFDDNSSLSSAIHHLTLSGSMINLGGSGVITHAGPGICPVFGVISFATVGVVQYNRTSNLHLIEQTKLEVLPGCRFTVLSGNLQLSSGQNPAMDLLTIHTNGVLNLGQHQVFSNARFPYSGITVDSAGTLVLKNERGLYNGTGNAALSSSGNLTYSLHPYSIVEYSGNTRQIITGIGTGLALNRDQQYGILKINTGNTMAVLAPAPSKVIVRTRLDLITGQLKLNSNTLYLENGESNALYRASGSLLSEDDNSILCWKNLSNGIHRFPFFTLDNVSVPVTINKTNGGATEFSVSTRGTGKDNKPYPSMVPALNYIVNGADISEETVIDRYWNIKANGALAEVTLTYKNTESTISPVLTSNGLSVLAWESTQWSAPQGSGTACTGTTGTVTVSGASSFGTWVVAANFAGQSVRLSDLNLENAGNEILISWYTTSEINNDYFEVERSTDGNQFETIARINGSNGSSGRKDYGITDKYPLEGNIFYRLKQVSTDGTFRYSETRSILYQGENPVDIRLDEAGPNPFDDHVKLRYTLRTDGSVKLSIVNLAGKQMYAADLQGNAGSNSFEFTEGALLPSGTYILTLRSNDKTVTQKLIKK